MLLKFFFRYILSVCCPGEAANDKPSSLARSIDVCLAHTAQLLHSHCLYLPDEATAQTEGEEAALRKVTKEKLESLFWCSLYTPSVYLLHEVHVSSSSPGRMGLVSTGMHIILGKSQFDYQYFSPNVPFRGFETEQRDSDDF